MTVSDNAARWSRPSRRRLLVPAALRLLVARRVPRLVALLGVLGVTAMSAGGGVGGLIGRAGAAAALGAPAADPVLAGPAGAWRVASSRWVWPLPPPVRVVDTFDPPAQPWLPGRRGVDLAGTVGESVMAAGAGVIGFVGTIAHVGVVTVVHGALRTTYEPVTASVRPGQQVSAGEVIGRLALTGSHCLPAACLHWGLLRGEDYLDPLALLGLGRVRLLPWEAARSP